mmetsp:Transcript_120610/g.196207  ORF Transcript_120610/g.196207 Transcript_120610/m.196207 type:complete len:271 (-) Transcript_120610:113-925(-)
MGSANQRQQALNSRGALSGERLAGGADAAGASVGSFDQKDGFNQKEINKAGQDDRLSVVFTWTGGGQNVFLAASFNAWQKQIPMVRSGNEFAVVQELPRGVHQYKFIVDDHWKFAPDQPKTQDAAGHMNNVCDISQYRHFEVEPPEEPTPRFSQVITDPSTVGLDAPQIPVVLSKSAFCSVPQWFQTGGQLPHVPTHAICDHVYLWQGLNEPFDPAQIVVTHRHGKKYSTTVFVTRSPFVDYGGTSTSSGLLPQPRAGNPLKRAVKRSPK